MKFILMNGNDLKWYIYTVICSDHSGGRAKSASHALKSSTSRNVFICFALLFSSFCLCFTKSYAHQAPFYGLVLTSGVLFLHCFMFVPVLITIFPPRKKSTLKTEIKPKKVKFKRVKSEKLDSPTTDEEGLASPSDAYRTDLHVPTSTVHNRDHVTECTTVI